MTIRDSAGFSLIETFIALGLLLVVAAGVLPLGLLTVSMTENQGHLTTRTTEYAQDKIEQLMSLAYGNSTSDTRYFPAADTGGSGLAIGGSSNPDAPVEKYVDYLDADGNLLAPLAGVTAPGNWQYKRAWAISNAGTNLKQITVTVTVRTGSTATIGRLPRSSITVLKTAPF